MKLLVILLWGFLATVVKGEEFVPKNLKTNIRPSLETNLGNHYKGRIHKCEVDGIRDIRELNSPYEEFWAYIPEKCTWIELGILEKVGATLRRDRYGHCLAPSTVSGIRKADVISLIKEVNKLTLIHPHPTNNSLVQHIANSRELANFSAACLKEARVETLEAALPGLPDLASMFEFSKIFYQYHPDGEFSEKIISAYGATKYSLTVAGLDALKTEKFEALRRIEMRKYLRIRTRLSESSYADEGVSDRNLEKIRELLKRLNSEVVSFSVDFKPFN